MSNIRDLYSGNELSRQARLRVARHFNADRVRVRNAMEEYEGTYSSMSAYARLELEEHLAPCMQWLLEFVDLDRVADEWIRSGRNWILTDMLKKEERNVVHVFLSDDPKAVAREREARNG